MHEFDKSILNYLNNKENTINETENRSNEKTRTRTKNYVRIGKQKNNALLKLKRYTRKINKPISEYNEKEKKDIREITKQLKKYRIKTRQTKSTANNKKLIKFTYIRYAEDWIILSNTNKKVMETIKEETAGWIKENLKLQISKEKTIITDTTKQYFKFLGFRFRNNSQKAPVIKFIRKDKPLKQIASWGIFWDIEHERITNRMQYKKYIDNNRKPCYNTIFMQLKPPEIIYRYRMIIEGIFTYFYPFIRLKSSLSRSYYYLKSSCYKTLAAREKQNIRQIIMKYGINPKIQYKEKQTNKQ